MISPFDYFVVFAEMRTGSNFLEANLNALDGVVCHGEAFNPKFIGYPNRTEILGVTQDQREAEPTELIERIRAQPDVLGGFRYFHDHDPRVFDLVLEDPRCAKIVLTRNPLDSYISKKIARETGQWKLTNVKRRKEAQVDFDAVEFARHLSELQEFQVRLLNRLQEGGQTAFYVAYEDLQSVKVMNGLAKWLGVSSRLTALDDSLKRQNPAPTLSKVSNPDDVALAMAEMDQFNLTRTPNFEPRRGPAVPGYVAAAKSPLLFLPVRGGPAGAVAAWLAALDDVEPDELITGMNQKQLRQWKARNRGFRSFTVLCHPAERIHEVFCHRILNSGPGSYGGIRETLRRRFKVPLPKDVLDGTYARDDHRLAFEAFLAFVKSNLAGQTSVRVDAEWASQSQAVSGFAELASPDFVLREAELQQDLPALAQRFGKDSAPVFRKAEPTGPYGLEDIYDADLEQVISTIYQRDYLVFGFGPWRGRG
ncbi:nodulation protein NodH [Phycobacter sp. K97]|uniref:nodulation protein NodH n=1 Tax=Phycobacter sedimenti TaxID=3133977 RepID=UPI003120149E